MGSAFPQLIAAGFFCFGISRGTFVIRRDEKWFEGTKRSSESKITGLVQQEDQRNVDGECINAVKAFTAVSQTDVTAV